MNLVLATVLIAVVAVGLGSVQATTTIGTVSECILPVDAPEDATCGAGDPAAPAAAAGILPGDRVVSVDGRPAGSWSDVQQAIRGAADRSLSLVVDRDGTQVTLVTEPSRTQIVAFDDTGLPVLDEDGSYVTVEGGFLGVAPTQDMVREPLSVVPGRVATMVASTGTVLLRLPQYMVGVTEAAFGGGERDPEGPVSVVGIGRFAGEIASFEDTSGIIGLDTRTAWVLEILAGLNIALFVFNLIPLLPLDGGHVAGALLEGVRKLWARARSMPDPGPVDVAKALPLAYGVAVLLLGTSVLLIYADLVNPVRILG